MSNWLVALAIIVGAAMIAGAVTVKPSAFETCLGIVSDDIFRQNATATLDPRDVEADAARICAGQAG